MRDMYRGFLDAPLSAKLGLVTITAYLFVALFAPVVAPYSETEILGGAYELWSDNRIVPTTEYRREHPRYTPNGERDDNSG